MPDDVKTRLMQAAKAHVVFDGWSDATFNAAARECDMTPEAARAICPNGAVDLAEAFHKAGDAGLADWALTADLSALRYSEKVTELVWRRLMLAEDKELVRRGMTLFSMPQHSARGAALIWGTADTIWQALGDTSDDLNWYSKRAILSGVYGASVLFWLGDHSAEHADTRAFIERRIANVMQFEKLKGQVRSNKALAPLTDLIDAFSGRVRAPGRDPRPDYPGWVNPKGDAAK